MTGTMHVSLLSNEQRSELVNLMQSELELIGYEDQAEINEIISNGLDGRLCDLEELIPPQVLCRIAN